MDSRDVGAVLVTGGAGYVGGFTVRALRARGERVVVVDDLSAGFRENVPGDVPLHVASVSDRDLVRRVLEDEQCDAVLHFAAKAYVGESVGKPLEYWANNVGGAIGLFGACVDAGVKRVVFSSTCTVYGEVGGPLHEDLPLAPVNPYGRTKAAVERMLGDFDAAYGMRSFRLRYFNAAGAATDGTLGEAHEPETHLIPLAIHAARAGAPLAVFGDDYPTPDGTCVRDYVHVEDLAAAHLLALDALRGGSPGGALNLGTGTGTSVSEVIAAVERVAGCAIERRVAPRRPGDPASLVAVPGRAATELGWQPRNRSIDPIVASAWAWHNRPSD